MEDADKTIENGDSVHSNGENLKIFQSVVHRAMEEIARGVSLEEFQAILDMHVPSIKKHPRIKGKLYEKLTASFVKKVTNEIDTIVEEEGMDEKFTQLAIITKTCADDEGTKCVSWRPPGNVEDHLQSPFMAEKLKHKHNLECYIKEKESAVHNLKDEVSQYRKQIAQCSERIEQLEKVMQDSLSANEDLKECMRGIV